MTARNCAYCSAPSEMFYIDAKTGRETDVDTTRIDDLPDHSFLCTWADDAPEGVAAMTGVPRWLQRNALSGHLMRPDDCNGCPCFKLRA